VKVMTIKTTLRGREFVFETKAGLFSKDHVDPGSLLLVENVEVRDGDVVVDLGCGWGAIGLAMAGFTPRGKVYMVDTDIRAVEYSQRNARLNHIENVVIVASDGFANLPLGLKCELVVSNPPSHTPKETIIEFIEGAKDRLSKGGKLYFVTERRIAPMVKREFEKVFGDYEVVGTKLQYCLSLAQKYD